MKSLIFSLLLLLSCQNEILEDISKSNTFDRFMITLNTGDFQKFKTSCLVDNQLIENFSQAKLNERLKTLNSGFIKSLFIILTCTKGENNKIIRNALGDKVFKFSPQIFFENLLSYKNKINNWEEIIFIGKEEDYKLKLSLIRDAATDLIEMNTLKNDVRKMLSSKL